MLTKESKIAMIGAGKLDYYKLTAGNGVLAELKCHLTIRILGFKYRIES